MPQLSQEARESIVLKALYRGSTSMKSVAESHNVSLSSLYLWIQRHQKGSPVIKKRRASTKNNELTGSEKFNHLLYTSGLDELSLGAYCREHGLYSHQLTEWRETFMTTPKATLSSEAQLELKSLREDNKRLERELRRKDKALAEAAALLILKKKADLIWGVSEDD